MFMNIFCSQNCLIMIVVEQVKICQKKEKKILQPHLEFIFYFYSSNFEDFFSFLIFLKTLLQNFSSSLSLTFLLCITQHQNLFIQLDLISNALLENKIKIKFKTFSRLFFTRPQIFFFLIFTDALKSQKKFFLLFLPIYFFIFRTWYSFETRRSTEAANARGVEKKNCSAIKSRTHTHRKVKKFFFFLSRSSIHPKSLLSFHANTHVSTNVRM